MVCDSRGIYPAVIFFLCGENIEENDSLLIMELDFRIVLNAIFEMNRGT